MYLVSTVLAVPVLPIVWCFPDLLLLVRVCLWSSNYRSVLSCQFQILWWVLSMVEVQLPLLEAS